MVTRTRTLTHEGLSARIIEVESDIVSQTPEIQIIGLPDTAVNEAKARIRSAIVNSGAIIPRRKIVVNLTPADLPKNGSSFDVAMALAVVMHTDIFPPSSRIHERLAETILLGELGLDGQIRPVQGLLPMLIFAQNLGIQRIIFPADNIPETFLINNVELIPVKHFVEVLIYFGAQLDLPLENFLSAENHFDTSGNDSRSHDLASKKETRSHENNLPFVGNIVALYGLIVAAAGGHHMLMIGPPGSGKTFLATQLVRLLPLLDEKQALDVSCLHSLAGQTIHELITSPPIQAPHHTVPKTTMVGGGNKQLQPGLISLAHHGVLFLDEATLFPAGVLDTLRQPIEHGKISVDRLKSRVEYPAKFQLILAANPCPCGMYVPQVEDSCTCTKTQRGRYLSKLSGPLLDRIDIRVRTQQVSTEHLFGQIRQTVVRQHRYYSVTKLQTWVADARLRAQHRLAKTPWTTNAEVDVEWLHQKYPLDAPSTTLLKAAMETHTMSLRGLNRIIRLAWTITDLRAKPKPTTSEIELAQTLCTMSDYPAHIQLNEMDTIWVT